MTTTRSDFDTLIDAALAEPVGGSRFPFLDGRVVQEDPHWDYAALARELVATADAVIDHGTGGGEELAGIGRSRGLTVATEAYAPNVPIAAKTLAPLGIRVVQVDGGTFDIRGPSAEHPNRRMPFDDESFDLVLARNVAFGSAEMLRILRPGGRLLTQMGRVGDRRPGEVKLTDHFPGVVGPGWPPWSLLDHLAAAGFMIEDYREHLHRTHIRDIGALVYYLRTAPWAIPDFTVDRYRTLLGELHRQILDTGSLVTSGTAILAYAVKPG